MDDVFDNLGRIRNLLTRHPFGLITDVDGTISPIAPTPQLARVSAVCRRFLSSLSHQINLVAALSGRPAAIVRDMIGLDNIVYIGNHGMERWHDNRVELLPEVRRYVGIIETVIKEIFPRLPADGVIVENKGPAVTFHYRLAPDPVTAGKGILDAVNSSTLAKGLKITRGKMSVELLPPLDIDKGTAALSLIREHNLKGAIYLGDDLTDINAFRAMHSISTPSGFQGLAIGVMSHDSPQLVAHEADFILDEGVKGVERFLEWLSHSVPQSG